MPELWTRDPAGRRVLSACGTDAARARTRPRGAQARLGALRRPGRVHVAVRPSRSRGGPRHSCRGSMPERSRRSSGSGARSRNSSATRSWPYSARRSPTATTRSARSGRDCASCMRSDDLNRDRADTPAPGPGGGEHGRGDRSPSGSRPETGEALALGDVVNTASRLQTSAPVGGLVVGEETYRATRNVIRYRELDAGRREG